MTPVDTWPIAKLTAVTAMSMMFIGFRNWVSATTRIEGGFSPAILFGPYRASREAASAVANPADGSVPNSAATSLAARPYGGTALFDASAARYVSLLLMTVHPFLGRRRI